MFRRESEYNMELCNKSLKLTLHRENEESKVKISCKMSRNNWKYHFWKIHIYLKNFDLSKQWFSIIISQCLTTRDVINKFNLHMCAFNLMYFSTFKLIYFTFEVNLLKFFDLLDKLHCFAKFAGHLFLMIHIKASNL